MSDGLPSEEAEAVTASDLESRVRAVQQQLHQMQTKTDSPGRSIGILLISLVAFIGLGAWFWSLKIVLYLLPILLFHELGHYVAMRYFQYRNVKMFFVPLLGAAVSGQHFNVAGWKKVIVSLAGPLPGIVLAIPMCIIALTDESEAWRNATLMVLLVNVFNLLPLLPLDGGWVAHALLFCRHPWWEATFRVAAAVSMILLGVVWSMTFLALFGGLMLIAAPAAFRNSQLAKRLRDQGVTLESADSQTIPEEVVRQIVEQLPTTGPASQPQLLARQTRQIFEVLNARPPGWLATLGLTLLYLSGWLITALVLMTLFLGPQWKRDWQAPPSIAVSHGSIEMFGDQSVADFENRYFVVGTFPDVSATADTAEGLSEFVGDDFAFATMGRSVLVSMAVDQAKQPAASKLLEHFKQAADRVDWYESKDSFYFRIGFVAPNEDVAKRLYDQANDMFLFGNDLNLVSPWSTDFPLSQEQERARETRRTLGADVVASDDREFVEPQGRETMSERLGRLPTRQNVVAEDPLRVFRCQATEGQLLRRGKQVRFLFIHFRHPIWGLPTLLQWLENNGCEAIEFQAIDGSDNEIP